MTPTRASAIAALVTAISLTSFAPAAFAEGPNRPGDDSMRNHRMLDFQAKRSGPGNFELVDLTCNTRAADRIDNRFDKLAERLTLTVDQQKLFDTFRAAALTAQTTFADSCGDLRPTKADRTTRAERPDMIDRMEMRLKLDAARLTAMNSVFPDLKAFYGSLTDEQKKLLMRGHGGRPGHMGDMGDIDMPGGVMAPGGPMAPDAPPAPANGLDG